MFKGTEGGDLIFSHFPGQVMGLCAFLTKSLAFRQCGSRDQTHKIGSQAEPRPARCYQIYLAPRNVTDFGLFLLQYAMSEKARFSRKRCTYHAVGEQYTYQPAYSGRYAARLSLFWPESGSEGRGSLMSTPQGRRDSAPFS
jgi:hypothetical protein